MRKNRTFYTLVTLLTMALFLFSGCQVSNLGESDSQALEVEMVQEAESSRASKVVTVYEVREVIGTTAMINKVFETARAGGYTKYYNKDGYKGTLRSTACNMYVLPQPAGSLGSICKVRITYTGVVTLPVILTKSVTEYEIREVMGTTAMINKVFETARAGGYTKYYNKDGYKGTLRSTACNMYVLPQPAGGLGSICKVRITYKGTVTKKM